MNGIQQGHIVAGSPLSYAHHSTSWTPTDALTPISTNPSRKRSRDESAFQDGEEMSYFSFPPSAQDVEPPPSIPEEPIYGEGMTLLNPGTGHALGAESQTGTWYEEKADQENMRQQYEQEQAQMARPRLGGRKSIRLSQSSIRAALDTGSNRPPAVPLPSQGSTDIDEATIALGIGWSRVISDDPDTQAAIRGWERYLEVHYPLYMHNATVLLRHRGLEMYLVRASRGFYLFKDDLSQGQLVSRDWHTCLSNLQVSPPIMEGQEVLQAERSPGPEGKSQENMERPNHTPGCVVEAVGMEIDT